MIEEVKKFELDTFSNNFFKYLDVDLKTLNAYKVGILSFSKYLKENNIENPTREDLISYRDNLRANYSSNTVNTYMIAIRRLFRYLKINNLYEDISVDIKGAKYNNTPKKQVLSLEEVKKIYNGLTDLREKCLFSLLITTGIRGIELVRADIEDIKIHNGEVVLWIQCKKHDEKDEYVKLSNDVLNDIKNYIGNRTTGSIFISTSNNNKNGRLTTTSVRSEIKKIFKRFGYDSDSFSLHSTRRTSATIMYQNGLDTHSIQQILHHKSQNTTTRYINEITRKENEGEYIVSNAMFN